jgi:hypothetical protein
MISTGADGNIGVGGRPFWQDFRRVTNFLQFINPVATLDRHSKMVALEYDAGRLPGQVSSSGRLVRWSLGISDRR